MHTTYCTCEQAKLSVFTWCICSCGQEHVCFACVCVYMIEGGGFCWMSHIVPVRPSDIAGGQRGMEPERGDSDK